MRISPLTLRRLRNFRRIRRAWYALWALGAVFVFCLAAELVCPCDPRAVVDPKGLEKYRESPVERSYDIRVARFNVTDAEAPADYEGPDDPETLKAVRAIAARVRAGEALDGATVGPWRACVRPRDGYRRVFLKTVEPPAVTERKLPPAEISFPFRPCREHPFGIDAGGRDVYARVVHGLRIALVFGLALALSGLGFGLVIGAVEGYFGGKTDLVCQRLTEIWAAMPFLYVMIFIGSTLGRGFSILLVSYAVFNWIAVSYYVRAEFLRLRGCAFVDAARVQGASALKVIFAHILPNALTPLITLFPFLLMGAIGSLAALDFLGFGLPPMTPSCGELLHEAQQFRGAWWLVLFPSLALFVVMLLTVLVGEGVRDAFDPRQRSRLE